MPELPDVEGFRRYLARYAQGHRIARVDVPDVELVRNRTPQALGRDDPDGRCPRCGTRLRRGTIAGRTACWCPRCQRRPRQ
jgi:formamidopyrimidine-DNA glycosylase